MTDISDLQKHLPGFSRDILEEIAEHGTLKEVPAGMEIVREGQYIKVIPLVLEGLVKVFTRTEDRELLLYYIGPAQSCIMSFSSGLSQSPSRIYAITEEPALLLLLPAARLQQWVKQYPAVNELFYQQYNLRYTEMLDTIQLLLFGRMDHRIYTYLQEQVRLRGTSRLDLRHKQIATDLGTAREVVTRVLKKLELEGKVLQTDAGIEVR